jgi:hypothetical protein
MGNHRYRDLSREAAQALTVTLLDRPSVLVVSVSASAARAIGEEIRSRCSPSGELRFATGGGIFGPPVMSWHEQADVRFANAAASPRNRSHVSIDPGMIAADESRLSDQSSSRRIGDWRVRPDSRDDRPGEPTKADMYAWLRELDLARQRSVSRYVGLIATAEPRGWLFPPRLHAWVVRRDQHGRAVCEPARVNVAETVAA